MLIHLIIINICSNSIGRPKGRTLTSHRPVDDFTLVSVSPTISDLFQQVELRENKVLHGNDCHIT